MALGPWRKWRTPLRGKRSPSEGVLANVHAPGEERGDGLLALADVLAEQLRALDCQEVQPRLDATGRTHLSGLTHHVRLLLSWNLSHFQCFNLPPSVCCYVSAEQLQRSRDQPASISRQSPSRALLLPGEV